VRSDDTQIAAKKLGVANILTGSVRRSDTMIRISAQLVSGQNGLERWSQDYDRSPGDALKIESDIAENVARALAITLGRGSERAITLGSTQNAGAHDLYLKAREQFRTDDSEEGLRHASGLLDAAISLDPKFAEAYALKSFLLAQLTGFFATGGTGFDRGYREAAAVAQQAIAIAPGLAAGHASLGYVLENQLNMAAAYPEFKKAYALAPGDVDNLLLYGRFLSNLGNQQAALKLARQAERQDPLNPLAYTIEASILRSGRRFDEAAAAYRKALQIAPKRLIDRALLSVTLMEGGKIDEAVAETEKIPPDYIFRVANEAMLFCRKGNRAASAAAVSRAQQTWGDALSFQYAGIYAQCGVADRAFAWLEKGWSIRDPGMLSIKTESLLDPIRSDPRFAALLQKMNFPAG
jgi:tetratricopeptide (TPR) repeat protein